MSFAEHPDAHVDASIAAIRDQTLSPQRAADVIAEQCRQALAADPTNAQTSDEDDTPWLQTFLWSFWGAVVKLAQDDVSFHDRIAHVLAALKAKGSHGCEGWRVWGSEMDWSKLPLLGAMARDQMNGMFTAALILSVSSMLTGIVRSS